MKMMLNGAVTLGTLDGANVEIHDLVGDDNIYLFGAKSEEVIRLYDTAGYHSGEIYDNDPEIQELVDFIVSKELIRIGDYIQTKERMLSDYEDQKAWTKKMLVNIAKAGYFSSDRTIEEYNRDIWHL